MKALPTLAGSLLLAFSGTVVYDGLSQLTDNKDADQLRGEFDPTYDIQITPLLLNSPDGVTRDTSFVSLIKKGSDRNEDRIAYSMARRTLPYVFASDTGEAARYNTPQHLQRIHSTACTLLQDYHPTPSSWYLTASVHHNLDQRRFAVDALIKMYCTNSTP